MEKVEIKCRCENCCNFEYQNSGVGYCCYWGYEQGDYLNKVGLNDFCSNGEPNKYFFWGNRNEYAKK